MFSSFGLSLSPSSLCGGARRRVGGTTERRKRGKLSHTICRRIVLDGLRKPFVVCFVAQRQLSTVFAQLSVSAEVQAAGEAQEEEEHARLVIGDLLFQDGVERTLAKGLGSGMQGVV